MDRFSNARIFEDSNINAILDRMYYELMQEFTLNDVDKGLCLSGLAAAILQGNRTGECSNIIFEVDDPDIYAFIQFILPEKLANKGVIQYKERTLYYFDGLYLEIWWSATAMGLNVTADGVIVRRFAEINPILL
jgi:hypothetical protein